VWVRFWAFRLTFTANTEGPEFTIDGWLNDAVDRAGTPLTVRFTVPEKPVPAVTVTLYEAVPPLATVCVAGVAAIAKSPPVPAPTTSVTLAVRVTGPLVARIVSG
jgi:hypothetical protein